MKERTQACRRWQERIALHAAGALEDESAQAVNDHLKNCPACRAYWTASLDLARSLHQFARAPIAVTTPPTLRARWRAALQAPQTGAVGSSSQSADRTWLSIWNWLPGGRYAWSSVAVCWMLIAFLRLSAPAVSGPAGSPPHLPLGEVLSLLEAGRNELADFPHADRPDPKSNPNSNRAPNGAANDYRNQGNHV
jgi:hypothetical protein